MLMTDLLHFFIITRLVIWLYSVFIQVLFMPSIPNRNLQRIKKILKHFTAIFVQYFLWIRYRLLHKRIILILVISTEWNKLQFVVTSSEDRAERCSNKTNRSWNNERAEIRISHRNFNPKSVLIGSYRGKYLSALYA